MKESLYYLFASGLILGSGPCLGFCAPVLIGFVAAHKPSLKNALVSYLSFSSAKLFSYMLLGGLCGMFSGILKSNIFFGYLKAINIGLGIFILLIGILTLIYRDPLKNKYCSFLSSGHLKNAGLLGLLAGFSPCLPLLGILNYIIIISHSPVEGIIYAFAFGLGTVISPVILLVALSGKLSQFLSSNQKAKNLIKVICGLVLILLGARIILK
ncbi:MAG: sulfite exporter TauE/SafE family protein [Candidatus Omnitrophica bacterium]|nr:sulfite exporter TauE/SafE family protein [Candidatus Omnitrophota bacterium]